jgi:hypothetical protein
VAAASIAPVEPQHQARAILTIVSAFTSDPVERWLFPDLAEYEALFRRSPPCSRTPSIQSNMRTCSRCWSSWMKRIRPSSIGICPGWASFRMGGARALVADGSQQHDRVEERVDRRLQARLALTHHTLWLLERRSVLGLSRWHLTTAAPSRSKRSSLTKSAAPARKAAIAVFSPIAPETPISGTSAPLASSTASALQESKAQSDAH